MQIRLLLIILLSIVFNTKAQVFLNEIRANDASTDDGEFIEIVGPAGTDVSNWQIEHYNGSGGALIFSYTIPEGTLIPDDGVRDIFGQPVGFIVIIRSGNLVANFDLEWGTSTLQNGPDGILLRNSMGNRVQALSWNGLGDLTGGNPPWRNIGSEQNSDNSLSAPDSVFESHSMDWEYVIPTPGMLNTNQSTGDISLPVQLSSFQAIGRDQEVRLVWVTQAELDNLGFIIERAYEKEGDYLQIASYESLDALKGAGNSSEKRRYEFIDPSVFNNITYWYRLVDVSLQGVRTIHHSVSATPVAPIIDTFQDPSEKNIPSKFELYQNYPNPFNPTTIIHYKLRITSEVEMSIYNSVGQKVTTLVSKQKPAGNHKIEWDASGFPSGVYYYKIKIGSFVDVKKMTLIR